MDAGMKQMKMKTRDLGQAQFEKLRSIFPDCVTEAQDEATGELKYSLDLDRLRQEFDGHIVEGPKERYRLDWPGSVNPSQRRIFPL